MLKWLIFIFGRDFLLIFSLIGLFISSIGLGLTLGELICNLIYE